MMRRSKSSVQTIICLIIQIEGDGRQGYSNNAPYNAIHIGAGAQEIPNVVYIYKNKI